MSSEVGRNTSLIALRLRNENPVGVFDLNRWGFSPLSRRPTVGVFPTTVAMSLGGGIPTTIYISGG
jgi:hypothetical protein